MILKLSIALHGYSLRLQGCQSAFASFVLAVLNSFSVSSKMLKLKQLQQKQQQQQAADQAPAPAADAAAAAPAEGQPAQDGQAPESYVLKKQNSKELAEVRQEKTRQGVLSLKAKGKRTGGKAKQNAAELRAQKGSSRNLRIRYHFLVPIYFHSNLPFNLLFDFAAGRLCTLLRISFAGRHL